MRSGMRTLEGQTALVTGGGEGIGRGIALALSARGVRIVVTGAEERALGETVGEIAHGGGKARHLAGEASEKLVSAAVDRALEVFGALDIVIHADAIDAFGLTFTTAVPRLRAPARLLVTAALPTVGGASTALVSAVREQAESVFEKAITCNAVVLEGALTHDAVDDAAMNVAELVAFLCGRAADGITGQTIVIRAVT